MRKVPVSVLAQFDAAGALRPLSITWENGRDYLVDRVLDCRVSRQNSGNHRYTVLIHAQEAYLYRVGDQWYMLTDA